MVQVCIHYFMLSSLMFHSYRYIFNVFITCYNFALYASSRQYKTTILTLLKTHAMFINQLDKVTG